MLAWASSDQIARQCPPAVPWRVRAEQRPARAAVPAGQAWPRAHCPTAEEAPRPGTPAHLSPAPADAPPPPGGHRHSRAPAWPAGSLQPALLSLPRPDRRLLGQPRGRHSVSRSPGVQRPELRRPPLSRARSSRAGRALPRRQGPRASSRLRPGAPTPALPAETAYSSDGCFYYYTVTIRATNRHE